MLTETGGCLSIGVGRKRPHRGKDDAIGPKQVILRTIMDNGRGSSLTGGARQVTGGASRREGPSWSMPY